MKAQRAATLQCNKELKAQRNGIIADVWEPEQMLVPNTSLQPIVHGFSVENDDDLNGGWKVIACLE